MKDKIVVIEMMSIKKILEEISLKTATRVVEELKNRNKGESETKKDLSIQDIIKITGLSKNFVYACQFYGEYTIIGKNGTRIRRIRREVFERRRAQGKPINKECNL